MIYVRKKNVRVQAWELGTGSETEQRMIRTRKMIRHPDGTYEVFSQECRNGKGQIANTGDYFKVDETDSPYPNERAYFLSSHRHLEGDWYLQLAPVMKAWRKGDPMCEEIRYLLDKDKLSLHPENPRHYFSAFLWGTEETAPEDAVVVFYSVGRDAEGEISDINFNFVVKDYFDANYEVVPECFPNQTDCTEPVAE